MFHSINIYLVYHLSLPPLPSLLPTLRMNVGSSNSRKFVLFCSLLWFQLDKTVFGHTVGTEYLFNEWMNDAGCSSMSNHPGTKVRNNSRASKYMNYIVFVMPNVALVKSMRSSGPATASSLSKHPRGSTGSSFNSNTTWWQKAAALVGLQGSNSLLVY